MKILRPFFCAAGLLAAGHLSAKTPASCCSAAPEPVKPTPACCSTDAPTAKPAEPACCESLDTTAPLSPQSLYQLETGFTNDGGAPVTLAAFRGRPVILTMFFASCGYACPLTISDITRIREMLPDDVREKVAIVLVSFDVQRDTPAALHAFRNERHLDAQWHLLHGDADAVSELAALLGVKYKQEADGMFAHSNLVTVLNPEGEIVHQRAGLKGGLEQAAEAVIKVAR